MSEKSRLSERTRRKSDIRVVKTKRAIFRAFIELLKKKPVNKITVEELARKAEINKGTFYLHYSDIYDLHRQALQQHMEEIAEKIDIRDFFKAPQRFSEDIVKFSFVNVVFDDDPFLTKENIEYSQGAHGYLCDALINRIWELLEIPKTKENAVRLRFLFAGTGSVFRYGSAEDSDIIADVISETIYCLFPQYTNKVEKINI